MRFLKTVFVALALAAQPAAAALLDTTPLSFTDQGLTATFSSAPNANAFVHTTVGSGFESLYDGVLLTTQTGQTLTIEFSQTVLAWGFNIAVFSNVPADVTFTEYLGGPGGSFVSDGTFAPTFVNGAGYVEGGFGFSNLPFDTLVLSTVNGEGFVIDYFGVVLSSGGDFLFPTFDFDVPEPLTLALFAAGAAGALRRRRKGA